MINSTYAEYAEDLKALGFDCSKLSDEQMDECGMAAERATNDWGWAHAVVDADDDYITVEEQLDYISKAKGEVEAADAESENEMIGRYVGGFYSDYNI
jgi:hypothetical protein